MVFILQKGIISCCDPCFDMNETLLNEIRSWCESGLSGRELAAMYTDRVDGLLDEIVASFGENYPAALLAVGGYGRGELCPYSDIDIMFLARDRKNAGPAEQVLYRLWDTGFEISHAFRTPKECIEEAFNDIKTRTSLLEARFVAGDKALYKEFREAVYPVIAFRRQREFLGTKLQEMDRRHRSSGASVRILEPNIKEGEGGLRDIHTAGWLSMVALKSAGIPDFKKFISPYDLRRFQKAYDFLLRSRFMLHLTSGRKNDHLSFEYQREVALKMGFRDSKKFRAAERFLRYYYFQSTIIRDTSRKIVTVCSSHYIPPLKDFGIKKLSQIFSLAGGRLIAARKEVLPDNIEMVMECFYLYSKTGKSLSDALYARILESLPRINNKTRSAPGAVRYFMKIAGSGRVYETLRLMHETGVLGRFIPEWGALRLLVVYEPYHMYTVDEHTLMAIRNLESLRTTRYSNLEYLRALFSGIKEVDYLYLAILFHDIGKAAGRNHEEEGYKRLKNIMDHLNVESVKRKKIEFLVRYHVLMARIALTREVDDLEVIAGFADTVETAENLRSLYLVTYADMSAVNPAFWTSWNAYMLRDLYERTMSYLSGIREGKDEYIEEIVSEVSPGKRAAFRRFIDEMPERYLVSTTREKIIDDFELLTDAEKKGLALRIDQTDSDTAELCVAAFDQPGLFVKIIGIFSSKGLNIVQGRIYTGSKGSVIDKITVSNWHSVFWSGFPEELEAGLRRIILDGGQVSFARQITSAGKHIDLFVELDNEISDSFSVVEVLSPDRPGLLYDIADVFFKNGCDVISARINTESGLAQDIFYIQSEKAKIDGEQVNRILSDLWSILRE